MARPFDFARSNYGVSYYDTELLQMVISQGLGEEKLKGTEHLKIAARGRSNRRGCKVGSRPSSVVVVPRGDCQGQARVFSSNFSHLV